MMRARPNVKLTCCGGLVSLTTLVIRDGRRRQLEAKIGRSVYHLWRKQQAFDRKRFFTN